MEISLGYGKQSMIVDVNEKNLLSIIKQTEYSPDKKEEHIIADSLESPIGTEKLQDICHPTDSVVVIVSDITRPVPSYKILPQVLEKIKQSGVPNDRVTIVFALGSHRKHTEEEKMKLVGEDIYNSYKCVDSDPMDYLHLGVTKKGTPIEITRIVAEADRRICIGNVEYHYFAGYSGGAKAIMPGCATHKSVEKNHSMMVLENAAAAVIEGNPVREDLEEAIQYCPIDFMVNVILDESKKIISAVSGHYIEAHRKGCRILDEIYSVKIPEKAEIVIVSQGGYPKDINLYQLQKALDNAKNAVKPNGTIILVGACQEGFGEKLFEEWLTSGDSPKVIIERIKAGFKLGAHKAAAIAMVMETASIYLVSEIDDKTVRKMGLVPMNSVQEAYDAALKVHGNAAGVIIMPYGGSTLPIIKE